jgi:antitoxin (DNA-binding transcriptional repressor) of toxin-antitoxin stability system
MIKVNIQQAKTHLSEYLDRLAKGETIILCKRNVPVVEIRPLPRTRQTKRPIGLAKNKLKIPKSFSNRCRTSCWTLLRATHEIAAGYLHISLGLRPVPLNPTVQ